MFKENGINIRFNTKIRTIDDKTTSGISLLDFDWKDKGLIKGLLADPRGKDKLTGEIIPLIEKNHGFITLIYTNDFINLNAIAFNLQNTNTTAISRDAFNKDGYPFGVDSTIAHEFGHVFGLEDSTKSLNDPYNLMWNRESERLGTRLNKDQIQSILEYLKNINERNRF
jgi:hypothetical protein